MANTGGPTRALRVAAGIMGIVFVAFAALQLNDPDPEIWGTFYAAVAVLSFAAAAGRTVPLLSAAVALGTLIWALPLLRQLPHTTTAELFDFASMKTVATEETREGLGLVIVSVWMAVLAWSGRKRN
jgi:hypothetical protein